MLAGNDLCARVFGVNAAKRHKMFKMFFTVQELYKPGEDRSKNPYQKVNIFLRWIKQVSVSAWNPKVTSKLEDKNFLRLNINTDYNHKMKDCRSAT